MEEEQKQKKQEEAHNEEQRKIFEWRKSSEWRAAKDLLVQKLILIDSCAGIGDNISNAEAGEQAKVNKKVFQTICDWIGEIEGEADAYEEMAERLREVKQSGDIYRTVE